MKPERLRWVIAGLLFLATTINYVDRQTLSILSPTLRRELGLDEAGYANAVSAFLISYTFMYSIAGRWVDRIGVRVGMVAAIAWWSVATMLTALTRGAHSLALFRFLLGIGEPAVYPAGIKACGEWFPKSERALPVGLFSSGSSVGAIIAPPLIAFIALHFGWRLAFLLPGAIGLLWIPFWLRVYRRPPPPVVPEAGVQPTTSPWRELARNRRVWALVLPRLASDPVWYFYLFWLPDYLQRERGMSLAQIGFYGWIPFLAADLGCLGGGALSDWLVRRGWSPKRARMTMLAGVGCLAPLGALVGHVETTAAAMALTSLVALLCQCWATNIATLAADLFPADTASVTGMMGTAGSLSGALFSQVLAVVIGYFGYPAAFVLAAALHPAAAITLFAIMGRRQLN
jgi:ACS family hexuronate transporter-like MFS transporter